MLNLNNVKTIYTHGGVFHADETFACALLRVLNPSLVIERVFKSPETVEDHELVVDIGLGRFDHHQAEGVPTRPDGGKRATVGLIWDEVKDLLFQTSETQDRFETSYIVPVETQDNGGDINPLSLMIGAMNPTWDEAPAVGAERFEEAVCFFEKLIEREQEREASALRGQNIVGSALERAEKEGHETVVVLEQFAPWQTLLVPSKTEYVVFPSNRGGWNVQTVPTELGGRESKKLLPAQEEMEGCTFRHVGGFLASFPTKEEAVKAVLYHNVDGVLYSKDNTELISYPSDKKDKVFKIPEGVAYVGAYAFRDNHYIEKVIIPSSVTVIDVQAFYLNANLKEVIIKKPHAGFFSMPEEVEAYCGTGYFRTWAKEDLNIKDWLAIESTNTFYSDFTVTFQVGEKTYKGSRELPFNENTWKK